jgi:hypothetical protein
MHRIPYGIFNSEDKKIPEEKNHAAFFLLCSKHSSSQTITSTTDEDGNAPSSNTLIKTREGYVPIGYR